MITVEEVGCFNPFELHAFFCPVCGGKEFVELKPYCGVWCIRCNAHFEVKGTCDGPRKIAVACLTENVWLNEQKIQFLAERYWTVIWKDDEKVSWMTHFAHKLCHVTLKEGEIVATKL